MATRETDGARWERLFFFSGCRPRFARLAASPLARACALHLLNRKKKRDCSQSRLQAMLQTSSQGCYPFAYPQCPALAFSGSLTGYWATCLVGCISQHNSQFPWLSASVFLNCSQSQLSVDQSFI